MTGTRKVYDEALKHHIVEELESGAMSLVESSAEYGVPRSLLKHWVKEYGRFRPERSVTEVVMRSEKERIAELEKALADATLKNRVYEEIIKIADKKYKTDLKKTVGSQLSNISMEPDTKSKRSARHSA